MTYVNWNKVMSETYRPLGIKRKPGRPRLSEEEKERRRKERWAQKAASFALPKKKGPVLRLVKKADTMKVILGDPIQKVSVEDGCKMILDMAKKAGCLVDLWIQLDAFRRIKNL